jgi:hypothetical protein
MEMVANEMRDDGNRADLELFRQKDFRFQIIKYKGKDV